MKITIFIKSSPITPPSNLLDFFATLWEGEEGVLVDGQQQQTYPALLIQVGNMTMQVSTVAAGREECNVM